MVQRVSLRQRLRYAVDNFLSRGSSSLFVALTLAFIGAIVGITLVRLALGSLLPEDVFGATDHMWVVFLELTDPGNMNQDNSSSPVMKVGAVLAGLCGVVIFSMLIAFITTALNQAIEHLRRGHSAVIESGHTLILGWTPRVVEILRELAEAMESERDPVVVILSETSKDEMDEHLRQHLGGRFKMRVVTRSGPTSTLQSLERVRASEAKSATVLARCAPFASQSDKLASDAHVIKAVLALFTHMGLERDMTVVAEVFDARNRRVVKDIAPEQVVVLAVEDILAKIMVQTSRTSGLAVVYQELLGFVGCEMYFHRAPFRGLTFGKLQFCFGDGVPIGVRRTDGEIAIRPALDYVMKDDDDVIIVAEDDSTIALRAEAVMEPRALAPRHTRVEARKEELLLRGWSTKAPIIIEEYAKYVLPGSRVRVMLRSGTGAQAQVEALAKQSAERLEVSWFAGDPLDREALEAADPFSCDNVIILPQDPDGDIAPERVDSERIVVLLHLRSIRRAREAQGLASASTKIVTEVLESGNQELVNQAGVNDVIISNRLVSMLFAQLSEERDIQRVYDHLFEEEGSEIYVKPASLYLAELPAELRFGDLMGLAQQRDAEVCIGIKRGGFEHDAGENYGVRLIPAKDELITVGVDDALIVVAEDET